MAGPLNAGSAGKRRRDGKKSFPAAGHRMRVSGATKAGNSSSRIKGNDDFFLEEDDIVTDDEGHKDAVHRQSEGAGPDVSGDRGGDLEGETADEKRLRLAKAYLARIRESASEESEEGEDDEAECARDLSAGARDSLVSARLMQETQESLGRLMRRLASRVAPAAAESAKGFEGGRPVGRRHRQSVTSMVLMEDDSVAFSASKDGMIVRLDMETLTSCTFPDVPVAATSASLGPARSNKKNKKNVRHGREGGSRHVLALAVSSDGRYLASSGLDRELHVWDTRTRQHLQAFPGHRGAVTGLAFRLGTHQLFSTSADGSVKLWSIDDMAYMDTLYGHQSNVTAIDCLRAERVVTVGYDRTVRLWRVPEETQLVFRGHHASIDCVRMLSSSLFVSGSQDGCLALWNSARKKPVFIARNAHGHGHGHGCGKGCDLQNPTTAQLVGSANSQLTAYNSNGHHHHHAPSSSSAQDSDDEDDDDDDDDGGPPKAEGVGEQPPVASTSNQEVRHGGPVGLGTSPSSSSFSTTTTTIGHGSVESWVSSVAVCRGSDLIASGAGNGAVRLWEASSPSSSSSHTDAAQDGDEEEKHQHQPRLRPLFSLPARGFVNALAFASTGRFLLAGIGQEPRLGRWGQTLGVRNGVLMYALRMDEGE